VNIRMQNDSKLPLEKRRNYQNCFEALNRIAKTEGFLSLYTGINVAIARAILSTIGMIWAY
jgi:solute carrier family 25 (mitochondrial dicarboxylate transporter), member 10